jgi:FkbM family methyltransferase
LHEVETRYGRLLVPDLESDVIGSFLARYGEWADLETRFICGVIEDGAAVADIGAFLGTFGIGLSQYRKLHKVCFIEANPEIVPLLRENVERRCPAAHSVIEALIAPVGVHTVGRHPPANLGATSFVTGLADPEDVPIVMPAQRMTLGDLVRQHGPFDLIKLDVEGMELRILEEDRSLLTDGQSTIWAECNESTASLELCDFLLSCGCKVFYFAFPNFYPENFKSYRDPILPYAYEAGLFAGKNDMSLDPILAEKGCFLERISDREGLRQALWRTPRGVPFELWCDRPEQSVAVAARALLGARYSRFLVPPEIANGSADADWSPVIELHEELQRVRSVLAMAEQPTGELLRKIARREMILAARVEQLGRTEQELSQAQVQLTEQQTEFDTTRAILRWAEQVSAGRLRLLQAERQLRFLLNERTEAERQRLMDALARTEAERQRLVDALARSEAERQRLVDALARSEQALARSEQALARSEQALAHSESELSARNETERQLRSELAEALARSEAEAARARSIETSTIWRASSVLRRALNSRPGLRRFIKRIARPVVRGLRRGLGRGRNRLTVN